MFWDDKLMFSKDQSLIASAGSVASTYEVDTHGDKPTDAWGTALGSNQPGHGGNIWLNIQITTAVTSSGSATVNFLLQDSANGTSYSTIWSTGAIAKASLTTAWRKSVQVPVDARQFLQMVYTIGAAAATAGAVTAGMATSPLEHSE